jgi:hypothetical protein
MHYLVYIRYLWCEPGLITLSSVLKDHEFPSATIMKKMVSGGQYIYVIYRLGGPDRKIFCRGLKILVFILCFNIIIPHKNNLFWVQLLSVRATLPRYISILSIKIAKTLKSQPPDNENGRLVIPK